MIIIAIRFSNTIFGEWRRKDRMRGREEKVEEEGRRRRTDGKNREEGRMMFDKNKK